MEAMHQLKTQDTFSFYKWYIPRLHCKLVLVQYWEYEYDLFDLLILGMQILI